MIKTNSIAAWFLAARPKTLSAAAVPVIIAIAMAQRHCYMASMANDVASSLPPVQIQWLPALLCLLFAWVMQIDSNFVNDYFDFKHGNDNETRLGPKRACAEGWITERAMKKGIAITTLLGCLIGLPLILYGGWEMIGVGVACVIFCFLYTLTLSYHGMGDLLVLLFFGVVPVCCTYYVIMPIGLKTVTLDVIWASLACGMVVDTLLLVNNYRDRDNDKEAGKQTLVLKMINRWGEKSVLYLFLSLGYIPVGIMVIFLGIDYLTAGLLPVLLPLYIVHLIAHTATFHKLKTINSGVLLNQVLGSTARNIFLYGIITCMVTLVFYQM